MQIDTVKKQHIVQRIRQGKLYDKQNVYINCDYTEAIRYQDILELYLYISGAKNWTWTDKYGKQKNRQYFFTVIKNILHDLLVWSKIYRNISNEIKSIENKKTYSKVISKIDKILYLRTDHWFNVQSGGSVGHTSGVIKSLKELGYETYVLSTDYLVNVNNDKDFKVLSPHYKTGRNIPNVPEILYTKILFNYVQSIWAAISPSIIYQRYSLGNYTSVLAKIKYRIPYICEFNGSMTWMARHWENRKIFHESLIDSIELLNLKIADLIVVVSKPMKKQLIQSGIKEQKILVNPNGVDTEKYHPNIDARKIRDRLNINEKSVVGFIGTMGPWHGADVLTEAFGQMILTYPHLRKTAVLLMIGDGIKMHQVQTLIEKYHLEGNAILTGLVPQESGPNYLAACDILVSPHVPNPDGTPFFGSPTKLFEYMAMGKGIVASELDQIGEILEHKKTAWLAEPGNVTDLSKKIKMLIENPNLRENLGKNARNAVATRYTWKEHTKRIMNKFKSLTS